MGKKSKGKNINRKNQTASAVLPPSEQMTEITIGDVTGSKTESEFQKNKEALFRKLNNEIELLETEKKSAEQAVKKATRLSEALETRRGELESEKGALQAEYDAIKDKYDAACAIIESAKDTAKTIAENAENAANAHKKKAESEAEEIRKAAQKKSLETLTKASGEARRAWQVQIDSLEKQIEALSVRERTLHTAQMKLNRERQDFELEKEALYEQSEHVQKLKERYLASGPIKVEQLALELSDAKEKYENLLENYTALSKNANQHQLLLDEVKTEIADNDGTKTLVSLRRIVADMQELKEKHDRLAAVYTTYPDDRSIAALEEKARNAERLECENAALELERNRYRQETVAARKAGKELEIIRQEVEATNALNNHLLQELESHKTALENRTGDTCPALSKVDTESETPDFINDINKRLQGRPISSLKELVSHVKNYAGSRKKEEQLFYTDDVIRAFLAGMAVSRLIILQGMSGTGKSSLPRIFAEAVSGFNTLIPVESSWRDRNELLGYYNDFNKKFNAKSFTIELYRNSKKRCREIPSFILLDEMNLARIEYYFSDFLAILQEPDHDKWLIELVSSDMRTLPMELPEEIKQKMQTENASAFAVWEKLERSRQGDIKQEASDQEKELLTAYLAELNRLTGAKDLIAGRKIKVSDNIWFIGTANRDESTFEISDKVYDRAQIVSLNKKGISEGNYQDARPGFIPVTELQALFDKAIEGFAHGKEVEKRLFELDAVLMDEFDTSFGNRIVKQTLDFAAVFVAAGGTTENALDYQISTKILRKVLSGDNEEAFLALLDTAKDYPETRRLIQKRMKELR